MAASTPSLKTTWLAALAVISALALAVTTPASEGARGGKSRGGSTSCSSTLEHPFMPWLDPLAYTLLPGGDFEARKSSWQLAGGAKVVSGNEPFKVRSSRDSRSLSIPAGGSAVTPEFCVGLGEPVVRFFAVGGSSTSSLQVEVLYRTALGSTSQTVGLLPRMSAWAPTPHVPVFGNLAGLTSLDGLTTTVQLRFTALGRAGWKIDDVFVDPWKVR